MLKTWQHLPIHFLLTQCSVSNEDDHCGKPGKTWRAEHESISKLAERPSREGEVKVGTCFLPTLVFWKRVGYVWCKIPSYPPMHCQGERCGEASNSDLWANDSADTEVSWLEGTEGDNLHTRRSKLYPPARRNVMRQVSLGMYSLRREPLKTYSTTASDRPALCRKGKNCLAFCVSWWTKRVTSLDIVH